MTSPYKRESSTGQEAPFEQSSSKSFLKVQRHLWVGVVVGLVVVSSIVLIRERISQPADRAKVIVQEATIVGPLVQHNVPTATVLLTNTGHSPAFMTKARLVMTVWTSDTFPDWNMPLKLDSDAHNIGEIAPEAVVPQTISLITPLTDLQGMHLERKDWFIVILGVISYKDTFDTLHETTLCLIWRDTSTEHLSPCEKWNETD